MADDRHRPIRPATTGTTPRAGAARTAASAPAAQRSGPDPLVELARLIGQNEGAAYEMPRAARPRDDRATPEHRAPASPEPPQYPHDSRAPRVPADRTAGRGAEYERYPDQRYAGYTEPTAATARQSRGQRSEADTWAQPAPDLADPYQNEVGWRPPRPRQPAPRPDEAASRQSYAEDTGAVAERPRSARPYQPVVPPRSESRPVQERAQAPAPAPAAYADEDHAGYDHPQQGYTQQRYSHHAAAPRTSYETGEYDDDVPPPVGRYAPQRDGYDGDDAYNYGGFDYDETYDGGRRKIWIAAALLVLAVVGTAGAYGLRTMIGGPAREATTPVIRADTAPKKIASASQAAGNDKQIQDRLADRAAGERVVPREEQPLPIKDPNASAPMPRIAPSAEPPPVVSAPATTAAANVRAPAAAAPAATEPKRIRTVTIRPEGEPADTPPARSAAPAAAVPATATPTARAVAPAAPAGNEPMSITPQSAPARTATAAPPPRSSTSGYVVQLSAQKSEADAKASFRVMQTKFPSVLGGQELIVRRKDLGSKGVYFGAQVGPFASQGEASRFCDELKAAGGTCIVQRN
jgi:hypothetical protein